MKNFKVIFMIISVVSSKPIEEIDEEHAQTNPDKITASNGNHFGDKLSWQDLTTPKDASKQFSLSYDETNFPEEPIHDDPVYDPNDKPRKSKRQLPDNVFLNKQFFENIFKVNRISRDTNDVPTIALSDLIHSVEHSLIHSAQNLAASNLTSNLTYSVSETNTNNVTVTNTQHSSIVLPISIPTPSPKLEDEFVTDVAESNEITTITQENLIRDDRSTADEHSEPDDDKHSEHAVTDFESVKPIEKNNLGMLFPISLNPSADSASYVNLRIQADHHTDDVPVTEEGKSPEQSNITVIQTINSTQLIPDDSSDVVHVHQQHITLFSADAGIFPNIHAVKAEDLPALAQTVETSSLPTEEEDCSDEETSHESSSDEESSSSDDKSSSSSESEEEEKPKKVACTRKSSVVTPSTSEGVTLSIETVKKIKTEELKEKIAEVEADPVILTQGI